MAVIRNLVVKIGADISGLQKGLRQAQNKITSVSNSISSIGGSLSMRITAPLMLLGSQSVKTAAQFEQSMANAASVSSATGEELEQMTELARKMGKTTVFSASEAADAMYYMASAGYKVGQMENAIAPILNLAAATQSDLAFSTDTVIATLNQFGLSSEDAGRVSNVFAAAIGASQATLEKLSYSMRYVGPVANSLGYSLEETTGALGILYNAGFKGEQAGTILRGALTRLIKPTSAITETLGELGLSVEDVNPSTKSMVEIIEALEKSGMTTAQAVAIFGQEAGPGMMAMISQGSKALEDMTNNISNTNSASDMAAKQIDTLQGSAKLMKSMMEEVAITIGNILLPIMNKFMGDGIMPLLDAFDGLSQGMKENVVKIGVLLAAIGPAILILGKVVKGVGMLVKVIAMITSPIGIVVASITALVGVLLYLWNTNEQFKTSVIAIWDKIKTSILYAINTIRNWWDTNGEFIRSGTIAVFTVVWETIKKAGEIIVGVFNILSGALTKFWNDNQVFRDMVVSLWENIRDTIKACVTAITDWWAQHGEAIVAKAKEIGEKLWSVISAVLGSLWESFKVFFSYVEPIWEQLKVLIKSLWEVMQELYVLLEPILIAIGALFAGLFTVAQGVFNGLIQALGPFIQALLDLVQIVVDVVGAIVCLLQGDLTGAFEHLKGVGEGFKNFFSNIWESMKNLCKGFVDSIVNLFAGLDIDIVAKVKGMAEAVTGWFKNMWQGVKDWCGKLFATVGDTFTNIGNAIWDTVKKAFDWGKNLISMFVDGLKAGVDWLGDTIKGIGQGILDFLGFSSPTKKGPCRNSDEWMPNMMSMFVGGIEGSMPDMQGAMNDVGMTISSVGSIDSNVGVPSGGGVAGDMTNAMMSAMATMNQSSSGGSGTAELSIDGNVFARLIMPSLTREFKRNGIMLKGV